jgi:hypothetical protein
MISRMIDSPALRCKGATMGNHEPGPISQEEAALPTILLHHFRVALAVFPFRVHHVSL